jgi:hypothetical protein
MYTQIKIPMVPVMEMDGIIYAKIPGSEKAE